VSQETAGIKLYSYQNRRRRQPCLFEKIRDELALVIREK
jgi:hypothetical protein